MGVGDAGQERHDAAEDHGDRHRMAGGLDGQPEHREDAAADHAADADGDDLGKAELAVAAGRTLIALRLPCPRAPRGGAHFHPAGACAASSAFRSTLRSATLAGGGEMPAPIMRRPRTWSAARLTESIATSRVPGIVEHGEAAVVRIAAQMALGGVAGEADHLQLDVALVRPEPRHGAIGLRACRSARRRASWPDRRRSAPIPAAPGASAPNGRRRRNRRRRTGRARRSP